MLKEAVACGEVTVGIDGAVVWCAGTIVHGVTGVE
jgi:hypothetical protein